MDNATPVVQNFGFERADSVLAVAGSSVNGLKNLVKLEVLQRGMW